MTRNDFFIIKILPIKPYHVPGLFFIFALTFVQCRIDVPVGCGVPVDWCAVGCGVPVDWCAVGCGVPVDWCAVGCGVPVGCGVQCLITAIKQNYILFYKIFFLNS